MLPDGTARYREIINVAISKEELDKKVEEFLTAEAEDPEVQVMLVSLQGD